MNNIQISELLTMIHEVKENYIQGNGIYDHLCKMDNIVSQASIDSGIVSKMSKLSDELDYKKLWENLKSKITRDLNAFSDPKMEIDSAVGFRIVGEKVILNTINKMEREFK